MVYKRYQSPFEQQKNTCPPEIMPAPSPPAAKPPPKGGFLQNIGNDDLILIGLILVLLLDDTESRDYPLLIALGFLLVSGWL